jgi:hypothetical protein
LSLTPGVGSFVIAVLLVGTAHVCFDLCLAEMGKRHRTSTVANVVNIHRYARVSMGMHVAFVVGCCEATEYIDETAFGTFTLSEMVIAQREW